MNIIISISIIYFLGLLIFPLLDALSLDIQWDSYNYPPLWLAVIAWPIAVPALLMFEYFYFLERLKSKILDKKHNQKRLRIAAQKEQEELFLQIEEELNKNEAVLQNKLNT